jgi:hypothetical protein
MKRKTKNMETQIITFPGHPLQLFRHYYPNSLQGQENGAEKLVEIEPDVHSEIKRPDGVETCTCGLVYLNDESGWVGNFGHRHHQTGELQPVARIKDEYTSPKGVASVTTSYRCEYCGSDEISDSHFFSSKGPGSRRKNIHTCVTEDFPLSRWELEDGRRRFRYEKFFFTPTPNSIYFETLGNVSVIVDSTGARLSGTGTHFEEAMYELLSNRSMLISEAKERLLEISEELSAKRVFDPWRVSDSRHNWIYRRNLNTMDGSYGFVKFSNEEVKHLSYETFWPWADQNYDFETETSHFRTVQFKMTKDYFIVYSDKIALPVAQVPVLGFEYLNTEEHNLKVIHGVNCWCH